MPASEAAPRIHTVGAVVGGIRRLLDDRVGRLWVVGEVSNLRRPASGHVYFTLKDERAQLRAALFRATARRLPFEPEDGLEVLVYGEVTVYAERGELQMVVRELEPRGAGSLQVAFEQLRRRLEAEGLFDADRKRPLPRVPRRVGVVTSASGAALRDVLEVAGRRWPGLPVRIAACRVQGLGAEREVAAALAALDAHGEVDVILLVRGGGSLEDLQAFNADALARAIAACRTPVVAGVGHETDVTIADLVADARAPTPSAAAELAIPERVLLAGDVAARRVRLERALAGQLERRRAEWRRLDAALRQQAPGRRVALGRERLRVAAHALGRAMQARLRDARTRHERVALPVLERALRARVERAHARQARAAAALDSLSPLAVLGRGYSLVRRASDGRVVRAAADAPVGEALDVRSASARLAVRVEASRDEPDAS